MVAYEGKAFNEKQVVSIEVVESSVWSKSVKDRYDIIMLFTDGKRLIWSRNLPETAISKLHEIVKLINERENEILKLKYKTE